MILSTQWPGNPVEPGYADIGSPTIRGHLRLPPKSQKDRQMTRLDWRDYFHSLFFFQALLPGWRRVRSTQNRVRTGPCRLQSQKDKMVRKYFADKWQGSWDAYLRAHDRKPAAAQTASPLKEDRLNLRGKSTSNPNTHQRAYPWSFSGEQELPSQKGFSLYIASSSSS